MTLALAPMDPSRRIDTLLRQLDRVYAVENAIHLSNDTRVAEVVHVAHG